jgi:cellulose synthase/poly-beta-1,6-N-acetylglucosamine synthase-like glycosyltransferase
MKALVWSCYLVFLSTLGFLTLYALRHYLLAIRRLLLKQPRDTMELVGYFQPKVSVLIPMHNEEHVAADILRALLESDYDINQIEILAINDRSEDATGRILDEFAARFPVIRALHRTSGNGGKPAALEFGTRQATGEILVLFDADYLPSRSLLKMLVAPFADPETGAVMGRVVPQNAGDTLLSALLYLERAAGYQIVQQARYHLGSTPQFGGTVAAVRASALRSVGGWNVRSLTEDTDLTCRLAHRGWRVVYVNRAECHEEVPRTWPVRQRQLARWVKGHNECLHRYAFALLRHSGSPNIFIRIDNFLMLSTYWTAPALVLGWLASLVLFVLNANPYPSLAMSVLVVLCLTVSNQATFFELGTAALLDGSWQHLLILPFSLVNFFASTLEVCRALLAYYVSKLAGYDAPWQKTARSRRRGTIIPPAGHIPFLLQREQLSRPEP